MGRSGATIARDYFAPLLPDGLQEAYRLVEDADLWRWALPRSAAFAAGFAALKLELDATKNPAVFEQLLAMQPSQLVEQGEALLAAQRAWVQQALAGAYRVQLGGPAGAAAGWPTCLAVSLAAGEGSLRSQLGNELAMKSREGGMAPAGIVAYREAGMAAAAGAGEEGDGGGNDDIKLSLRAVDGFDTTVVTKHFGGGGHLLASSCIIPAADYAAWRLP